jgi:hypothetical protein
VLEPIGGVRVVATPEALDRAVWHEHITLVWRFAPDEAFGSKAGFPAHAIAIDDPHAIVEPEHGFLGAYLMPADVVELRRRCDFAWPDHRPAIVQGRVAGVPVKIWLADFANGDCLLVHAAYADELARRLGW